MCHTGRINNFCFFFVSTDVINVTTKYCLALLLLLYIQLFKYFLYVMSYYPAEGDIGKALG